VVNAGSGKDTFTVSDDELIAGAGGNVNDVIVDQGGEIVHGFVGPINSDSPWITSIYNGIRYGLNTEGQLVIKETMGNETFVAGYTGGTDVPLSQQTDGIFVGRGDDPLVLDLVDNGVMLTGESSGERRGSNFRQTIQ
jgi:hypothetical protein